MWHFQQPIAMRKQKRVNASFVLFSTIILVIDQSWALTHSIPAMNLRDLCMENTNQMPALVLPGVYDSLSAKIFVDCGADALFLSGFGVSASRLGCPDVGILTQSEMEDTAKSVVEVAGSIPVIVDGDTGYGGPLNIRRTVRGLASVGAAAVTIEDQVFPKRCTYAAGADVRVISRETSYQRIQAAIAARDEVSNDKGKDILIIARTDCRAALGFEETIARCKLFEKAGADIVYAENLQSKEEYAQLRESLNSSTIMMLAQVQLSPNNNDITTTQQKLLMNTKEIGKLGYRFALFGVTSLQATVQALQTSAAIMLDSSTNEEGNGNGLIGKNDNTALLSSFDDLKLAVGFPKNDFFEDKYNHIE